MSLQDMLVWGLLSLALPLSHPPLIPLIANVFLLPLSLTTKTENWTEGQLIGWTRRMV